LGIRAYVGYFFNHDSPRRSERHVTKLVSETARRIGAGSPEKLEIGDMDVVKEWTFAGDVVKGIWTLVQQEDIMEANISSGEGHSIREWVELCFGLAGKDWREHVVKREGFSSDHRQLVSNPSRIFSLGWKPETGFTDLAAMMMR
jgi:GDPmannose 4,6-dehydratase